MRNILFAVVAAAIIAGTFVFLTEPIAGASSSAQPAAGETTQSGLKGDRLNLRQPGSPKSCDECAPSRALPVQRPRGGFIVVVNIWADEPLHAVFAEA